MSHSFGWDYSPGAANDPRAPWNQGDPGCETLDCEQVAEFECVSCHEVICDFHAHRHPHQIESVILCPKCYDNLSQCAQCRERIWADECGTIFTPSDEYGETARGPVHVGCFQEGEEIA